MKTLPEENPGTVEDYISVQPEDQRMVLMRLRQTVLENLPEGFNEQMQYGMIGYVVPHEIYPRGYHCDPAQPLPFLHIANQKHHIAFYHLGIYMDPGLLEWFVNEWQLLGIGKLDLGKSCIRFKALNDIPWPLIAELCNKMTPKAYIERYEAIRSVK